MTDPLDILRSAKLPETTVPVCVRGDLAAQFEKLEKQLATLNGQSDRLVGNPEARQIAEEMETLRGEMDEATVALRLRALSHRAYAKLEAAHKPRSGEEADRRTGFNMDTFPDALVRACVVDPELDDDTWAGLADALTFQQWDNLFTAAYMLNRREVTVPFSATASRILQSSGEQ